MTFHLWQVRAAFSMTPSQERIFTSNVCTRTVTLVWGPPGSGEPRAAASPSRLRQSLPPTFPNVAGKTYFLAASVCRLLHATAHAQTSMRVLLTAFTHRALGNLFTKVATMLRPS